MSENANKGWDRKVKRIENKSRRLSDQYYCKLKIREYNPLNYAMYKNHSRLMQLKNDLNEIEEGFKLDKLMDKNSPKLKKIKAACKSLRKEIKILEKEFWIECEKQIAETKEKNHKR